MSLINAIARELTKNPTAKLVAESGRGPDAMKARFQETLKARAAALRAEERMIKSLLADIDGMLPQDVASAIATAQKPIAF